MDEDEPSQLIPSDSRPTDIGQIHPTDSSPKSESFSEDVPFSDPLDEIHEGPRLPTHPSEEAVKVAGSTISTPPPTGSEKVQEDDIYSLHADTPDICDEDTCCHRS
jgi:hypothetical protein